VEVERRRDAGQPLHQVARLLPSDESPRPTAH
jgi:hypothetical protein